MSAVSDMRVVLLTVPYVPKSSIRDQGLGITNSGIFDVFELTSDLYFVRGYCHLVIELIRLKVGYCYQHLKCSRLINLVKSLRYKIHVISFIHSLYSHPHSCPPSDCCGSSNIHTMDVKFKVHTQLKIISKITFIKTLLNQFNINNIYFAFKDYNNFCVLSYLFLDNIFLITATSHRAKKLSLFRWTT